MANKGKSAVSGAVGKIPQSGAATLIVIIIVVLLLALSATATLVLTGGLSGVGETLAATTGVTGGKAIKKAPMNYVPLDPPFVMSFSANAEFRYLKISVEAGTRNSEVVELIKVNRPAIRNSLVLLFSNQRPGLLNTREGMEQLRDQALVEVRKVLKDETGKASVESIYFTGFAMQ